MYLPDAPHMYHPLPVFSPLQPSLGKDSLLLKIRFRLLYTPKQMVEDSSALLEKLLAAANDRFPASFWA